MKITCGIYLYNINSKKFLLCHATRSKANLWSIPKGILDENETIEEAAFRELFEETGIMKDEMKLMFMQSLPPVKYKKQNKVLESFLIVASIPPEIELKCHSMVLGIFPEIDRYTWATIEEMKELAHESQVMNLGLIRDYLEGVNFPEHLLSKK
jgi:8-oxo-dGTP pyrophosphatase MutT (NUDIX family)